jgi:hypothetical protein
MKVVSSGRKAATSLFSKIRSSIRALMGKKASADRAHPINMPQHFTPPTSNFDSPELERIVPIDKKISNSSSITTPINPTPPPTYPFIDLAIDLNESPATPSRSKAKIEYFFDNIQKININKRLKYIDRLHAEDGTGVELFRDKQLKTIFDFIIHNKEYIKHDLKHLKRNESFRISRKPHIRNKHYKKQGELPFNLEFEKNIDGTISVYALPKSKLADHTKDHSRKHHGVSKSVTPRILLNPQNEKTKLMAEVSKKTHNILAAEREGLMSTAIFGSKYKTGKIYYDSQQVKSINTSEKAAISDLSAFINPSTRRELLKRDSSYDLNNHDCEQEIMSKLIRDILKSMKKIHDTGIIHNDIKGNNILVFIYKGHLNASISDFDFSIYQHKQITKDEYNKKTKELTIKRQNNEITEEEYDGQDFNLFQDFCNSQPVATAEYASPEVVGFTVETWQKNKADVIFSGLYEMFNLRHGTEAEMFAVQLLEKEHENNESDKDYTTLKSDPKDDMFSLGVTLYMLITGHYPCVNPILNEQDSFSIQDDLYIIKYLDIDTAASQYPLLKKFEPLIRQLLAFNREQRPDATQALELFDNLHTPGQRKSFDLSLS